MENQYLYREESGCGCGCSHKKSHSCQNGSCESKQVSGCQVERSLAMWECASHKAWKEVHIDLLKSKILKMWGPQMERSADAVVEAMGIEWQAMLTHGKAKEELQEKITKIFSEGRNQ